MLMLTEPKLLLVFVPDVVVTAQSDRTAVCSSLSSVLPPIGDF